MARRVSTKKNRFNRNSVEQNSIRQIHIFIEGRVTEPEYLDIAQQIIDDTYDCHYKFALRTHKNKGKSSPKNILNSIIHTSSNFPRKELFEIWTLFDQDNWPPEQIKALQDGIGIKNRPEIYQALISKPQFELWILLHFENATGVVTSSDITKKIKDYIHDYDKHLPQRLFNLKRIDAAIQNAKNLEKSNGPAQTQVYILIEHLLDLAKTA